MDKLSTDIEQKLKGAILLLHINVATVNTALKYSRPTRMTSHQNYFRK